MALIPVISVRSLISLLIIVQTIGANPLPQNSQGNPGWNGPPGQVNNGQGLGWNAPPGQVYLGQGLGWNGAPGQGNSGQGLGWNGAPGQGNSGQGLGWNGQGHGLGLNGQGQSPGWSGQGQGLGWNGQGQSPGWSGQGQGPGWSGQVNSGQGGYNNPSGQYSYQNQYPNRANYLFQQPNPNGMNQIQPTTWNYGYNPNNNNAGSAWNRWQSGPGSQLGLSQFPSGNGLMNNVPPGGQMNDWMKNYGGYPNQNVNQRAADIDENTTPKEKQ